MEKGKQATEERALIVRGVDVEQQYLRQYWSGNQVPQRYCSNNFMKISTARECANGRKKWQTTIYFTREPYAADEISKRRHESISQSFMTKTGKIIQKHISERIKRRRQKSLGYYGCKACKMSFISAFSGKKRLLLARKIRYQTLGCLLRMKKDKNQCKRQLCVSVVNIDLKMAILLYHCHCQDW